MTPLTQTMTRLDILQAIAWAIGAQRYLEIGVQKGETFTRMDVPHKTGVDPDEQAVTATVHTTSDDFFSQLAPDERFDLVFVDGLHHAPQALRDIVNAERRLTPSGVIVVHDCDPPDERAGGRQKCHHTWCGDVWRAWLRARLLFRSRCTVTVDADLGCGLILPGHVLASPRALDGTPPERLDWQAFAARRSEYLNLVSPEYFGSVILPALRDACSP